jgi:ABC-type Fe3+-hydroxamate transport system substrate-binding protein
MIARRKVIRRCAALLVLALIACTRTAPPAPPTPPPTGARVVALSPAIASIMADVGLADRLVGRHGSDEWCDQSLPVCGDQVTGVSYEALLRIAPTHVFLQVPEIPPRLRDFAESRGVVVQNFSILSLDEIRTAARRLTAWNAGAGPVPDTAPRAAIEDRMDTAWSRQPGVRAEKVGRVLLLAGVDPAGALGPGSWHDDLLRRLGATPAISTGAAYITMDAEDVLRLAPDAIILFAPRPPTAPARPGIDAKAMLGRLGTLDIPAVRAGRIAIIDDPMGQLPSTAMIRVAQEMTRVLVAWSH